MAIDNRPTEDMTTDPAGDQLKDSAKGAVNRRGFLAKTGLLLGGTILAGAGVGAAVEKLQPQPGPSGPTPEQGPQTEPALFGTETVPFYGPHQSGIATAPQTHAVVLAFHVDPAIGKDGAKRLLRILSQDAQRLSQGEPSLTDAEPELATNPANLTVTVGLGPNFFDYAQISQHKPGWLKQLPGYRIDALEERWNEGDLVIQLCGDDEIAVAHARRILTRQIARFAQVKWAQRGFKQSRGSQAGDTTMRNLMGQVDGTANLPVTDHDELLWCGPDQGIWEGGTSMVVRRIAMNLDTWDEVDRIAREDSVGRTLSNGAPLTGTNEHDVPDFDAVSRLGFPIIPEYSHVRRSRPDDPKQRIWRRAYNYDDAPLDGHSSNSGLVFISFQADVDRQYAPIQERLAEMDALNEWTTPIGSAVFAVLPGCQPGQYLGQTLLEA